MGESFITHHTATANLTGRFLDVKPQVPAALRAQIDGPDDERAALRRSMKRSL